jgi:hypothetical protein
MYQIAQNFTLRIGLSFTVCASLLLLPSVSLLSEASSQVVRNVRPGSKKPVGTLPDLEEVKYVSNVEREAPPPIPSTLRGERFDSSWRAWTGDFPDPNDKFFKTKDGATRLDDAYSGFFGNVLNQHCK